MHAQELRFMFVIAATLALAACGDDAPAVPGTGGSGGVNVSGACGAICDGELMCVVEGVDPSLGRVPCVQACQQAWPREQECRTQADNLLICVDANGRCETLEEETCAAEVGGWLGQLTDCLAGN